MNKLKYVLLLLLPLTLASCSTGGDDGLNNNVRIISPNGAPCLAYYNYADKGQLDINTDAALVGGQLQADNYDIVTFDFYKGLSMIKRNHGHYKLARIITGGNLYLVGINKNEATKEPSKGDLVVSFAEGGLPDLAYLEIYKNSGANVKYVNSVSDIPPILKTGKFQTETVDYVLIAEPVMSKVFATLDVSKYTVVSIRERFGEIKHVSPVIPQAGLFINMNSYNKNIYKYQTFLSNIDADIDLAINDPIKVKELIVKKGDAEAQEKTYGFTGEQVYQIQNNRNGFALVSSDTPVDINQFLSIVGIEDDFSEYIL